MNENVWTKAQYSASAELAIATIKLIAYTDCVSSYALFIQIAFSIFTIYSYL